MGRDRDKGSGEITVRFSATILSRHVYQFATAAIITGAVAIGIGITFPLLLGLK